MISLIEYLQLLAIVFVAVFSFVFHFTLILKIGGLDK